MPEECLIWEILTFARYFETKVEHFAPYLLKDGLVQKVTKFENNLPEAEEVIIALIDGFSKELPREIEVVQIWFDCLLFIPHMKLGTEMH